MRRDCRRQNDSEAEEGQQTEQRIEWSRWKGRARGRLFDLRALTPESVKRGKRWMSADLPTGVSHLTHPPLSVIITIVFLFLASEQMSNEKGFLLI